MSAAVGTITIFKTFGINLSMNLQTIESRPTPKITGKTESAYWNTGTLKPKKVNGEVSAPTAATKVGYIKAPATQIPKNSFTLNFLDEDMASKNGKKQNGISEIKFSMTKVPPSVGNQPKPSIMAMIPFNIPPATKAGKIGEKIPVNDIKNHIDIYFLIRMLVGQYYHDLTMVQFR